MTQIKKISEYAADASPATEDLILTVVDPSGTPDNRKVTIEDLFLLFNLVLEGSDTVIDTSSGGGFIRRLIGTTGGLKTCALEATASITASATITISLSIPSGVKILGTQLRVDSALATGQTWNASFSGGSDRLIATDQAVAKNTKVNAIYEPSCYLYNSGEPTEVTDAVTNIAIKRFSNPGVDTFTAQGTIRAIVFYDTFGTMGDA